MFECDNDARVYCCTLESHFFLVFEGSLAAKMKLKGIVTRIPKRPGASLGLMFKLNVFPQRAMFEKKVFLKVKEISHRLRSKLIRTHWDLLELTTVHQSLPEIFRIHQDSRGICKVYQGLPGLIKTHQGSLRLTKNNQGLKGSPKQQSSFPVDRLRLTRA